MNIFVSLYILFPLLISLQKYEVEAEDIRCILEHVMNNTLNGSNPRDGKGPADCFKSLITGDLSLSSRFALPSTANVTAEKKQDVLESIECENVTENSEVFCVLDAVMANKSTMNCTYPSLDLTAADIQDKNCTQIHDHLEHLKLNKLIEQVLQQTISPATVTTLPTTTAIPTIAQIYDKLNGTVGKLDLHSVNNITTVLEQSLTESNASDMTSLQTVAKVLSHLSEVEMTTSETVQTFTRVSTTVIQLYNESDSESEEIVPDLLYSMENVLSSAALGENISIHSPEIDLFVEQVETNLTNGDVLTLSSIVGTIALPVTVFDGKTSRVSVILYKTINQRWSVKKGYQNAKIGSNIMSVSVQQPKNAMVQKLEVNMTGAVVVVLPTNVTRKERTRFCTYWSFKESYWDPDGGTVLEKNDTHTKCQYDHMTNFAVLVLYYSDGDPVTKEESHTLYILTALGCSLSIACLLVCLIIYLYLKVLNNETVMIHANLSLALMLAQLVLVTSDGASKHETACKVVTVMMHFLFLSAFTWMMVEGLALYLSCTQSVCNYRDMRVKYMVMGWGIPAVIVLISLGAQFPNYGDGLGDNCWLSINNGLIWSFMGPLIIIVVFNIIVLCLVLKVFLTLRTNSRKSEAARIRASLRAVVTLLPILGITWLFGILVPLSDVFHYLFVIGNSTQGMMIFFLHCVCNSVVRKKFIEKRKRQSSSAWSGDLSDLSEVRANSAGVSLYRKRVSPLQDGIFCQPRRQPALLDVKYTYHR